MELKGKASEFFARYCLTLPAVGDIAGMLLYDMERGLVHDQSVPQAAAEPMIRAPGSIPRMVPAGKKAIVIDAGGTNFRSCIVDFAQDGTLEITDLRKTAMPGIEHELSKDAFYDAIAANLDYLKGKADRIGFCFSYAMEITDDNDGRIIVFSKEIKASQAVGTYVGKSLSEALVRRGWERPEKITLLNDTMASLLAGTVTGGGTKQYSSYVGFILGTGINSAYIEYDGDVPQNIVITECGMYNRMYQSIFDKEADSASVNPGASTLEKMCSGVYLGKAVYRMLVHACNDKLFSDNFCHRFSTIDSVSPADVDAFLYSPFDQKTLFGVLLSAGSQEDRNMLCMLLDTLIERTARIVSGVLSAAVIKSGKGTEPSRPVCIVCNGTTFWRTHELYNKVQYYLKGYLADICSRHYEIVKIDNDITLGTAAAALR